MSATSVTGIGISGVPPISTSELEKRIAMLEAELSGDLIKWGGKWIPGQLYTTNTLASDGQWSAVALTDTYDRLAPQPFFDPEYTLPDSPSFATTSQAAVIHSGQMYEFSESGWVKQLRVYATELSSDVNYRVVIADITDVDSPVFNFITVPILVENEWATVAVSNQPVVAGTTWLVYLDALDSGSSTTISGGWRYGGKHQSNIPATQKWNGNNQNSVIRINKTDLDGTFRGTELLSVVPNSVITIVQSTNNSAFLSVIVTAAPIDRTDAVEYVVSPNDAGASIANDAICTIDIEVPIPATTEYAVITDQWTVQPSWANVSGYLAYNGVPQPDVENNAYGVDILFQKAYVSPDWSYLSYSSIP